MWRTQAFRYSAQEKYTKGAQMLADGAVAMLAIEQAQLGADLALNILDIFENEKKPAADEAVQVVLDVCARFPADDGENLSSEHKKKLLGAAVRWSAKAPGGKPQGHARLHTELARISWDEQDLLAASNHFARGDAPRDFAAFLVEWCKLGQERERELFLVRGVLQLLHMDNMADAKLTIEAFRGAVKLPHSPLINFLGLLLSALEQGEYELFAMLVRPPLERTET